MARVYVYVIMSAEGFRYIGITDDLDRRIMEHNDHSLSFWTKRGTNWKIVHVEDYPSPSEAMKREKWLKSGVGREFLKRKGLK